MTLEDFRKIDIQLDKANDYIVSSLFAKAGDYNGRSLTVQITNGRDVINTTGVDLNFGWKHNTYRNQGLEKFKAIDLSKGIYEIIYPKEMLNAGIVTCFIQIVESPSIISTRNFDVTVELNPVNENFMVTSNSFKVLQEALLTVNSYDARIAKTEAFKAEKIDVERDLLKKYDKTQAVIDLSKKEDTLLVDEKLAKKSNTADVERDLLKKTNEVDFTREIDALNTRSDSFETETTAQFQQIMTNVKTIGAKGNGVDSDVNAIVLGSKDGVTLGFPDGTYVIDSHILIKNKKRLKWVTLGANVSFLDIGQEVGLNDGTRSHSPFGILFEDCDIEFSGFNHTNLIKTTGKIAETDNHKSIPQLDFKGGKVKFSEINITGLVQPYPFYSYLEDSEEANPAIQQMRGSYVRFYQNDYVKFEFNEITSGAGGGEIFSFFDVKDLHISYSGHQQKSAPITFWSFAKIINCGKVNFNNIEVQSQSIGSFIDVSGEHIVLENVVVDSPKGKFIDLTQEWGYANINTGLIEVNNCKTNTNEVAFISKHNGTNLKEIEHVILDNIEHIPTQNDMDRAYVIQDLVKKLELRNLKIKNVRYVNHIGDLPSLANVVLMNNVEITSDKPTTNNHSIVESSFITHIKKSYINQNFINDLQLRDRTHNLTDLRNSKVKIIIEDTIIENTVIDILANVEFINCKFKNVSFRVRQNTAYPSITFNGYEMEYTSETLSVNDFMSTYLASVNNLIMKNGKKIKGNIYRTASFITIVNWNILGVVDIDNLDIDIQAHTSSGAQTNTELLRFEQSSIKNDVSIKLNKVKVSSRMRAGINVFGDTTSLHLAIIEVIDSEMERTKTPSGKQLVIFSNANVGKIEYISQNNRFLEGGQQSPINSIESYIFKKYRYNGNVER